LISDLVSFDFELDSQRKFMISSTPVTPYYAVIFTSIRTEGDNGYSEMADQMVELARQQEGFLGIESSRTEIGITVSYWRDLDCIKKWRDNMNHSVAREKGRKIWYQSFKTRIAKVESDYGFNL
jgi:heme-degrading monooxygenase HmoA